MENFIIGIMIVVIALVVLSGGLPGKSGLISTDINGVNLDNQKKVNTQYYQNQNNSQNEIQTAGKEGDIDVSASRYIYNGQNIYVGSKQAQFIGVTISAMGSDVDVQRIRVNLGSGSGGANFISQVASKIYIMDSGYRILASSDINKDTVNREYSGATNTYSITLSGFHFLVPQNSSRDIIVAFDIYPVIDSIYRVSYTISVDANSIRAVDGANINHTGPKSPISQTQTIIGGQYQTNF